MSSFPERIQALEPFSERFDAFRLRAEGADVLFAVYPAGTTIPPHDHDTENHGVITKGELILIRAGVEERYGPGDWYHLEAGEEHAARFEVETEEIEFWFRT
ncbi:MAG: cupin domain-containing protein [Kiloniellales bacterium]|nr:cupin domain-containing protein [Kiloniellales bacterium]